MLEQRVDKEASGLGRIGVSESWRQLMADWNQERHLRVQGEGGGECACSGLVVAVIRPDVETDLWQLVRAGRRAFMTCRLSRLLGLERSWKGWRCGTWRLHQE